MTLGVWLQVVGGALELLGLGTVMLGISETRRRFTDRPSLLRRGVVSAQGLWNRVRRKPKVVEVGAAGEISIAGRVSGRLMKTVDWDQLNDEQALQRLRQIANEHSEALDRLESEIEKERRERTKADEHESSLRATLQSDLDKMVRLAAAGGLTLQTWGAGFLAVGIILMIAGVWLG